MFASKVTRLLHELKVFSGLKGRDLNPFFSRKGTSAGKMKLEKRLINLQQKAQQKLVTLHP